MYKNPEAILHDYMVIFSVFRHYLKCFAAMTVLIYVPYQQHARVSSLHLLTSMTNFSLVCFPIFKVGFVLLCFVFAIELSSLYGRMN